MERRGEIKMVAMSKLGHGGAARGDNGEEEEYSRKEAELDLDEATG